MLVALLLLVACSRETVRRTTGTASTTPSASATDVASPSREPTPEPTKAPGDTQRPLTPQPVATYTSASGIDGKVEAGPTCPVERVDEPCPARPVTDATVTARGPRTKSTKTNSKGAFTLRLEPGTYQVSAESRSVFGCGSKSVKVVAHRYTHVTIDCDTGIR